LTVTFDEGLMRTCLFPRSSALTMLFYYLISTTLNVYKLSPKLTKASLSTDTLTILN
jgi:hypothetical protein